MPVRDYRLLPLIAPLRSRVRDVRIETRGHGPSGSGSGEKDLHHSAPARIVPDESMHLIFRIRQEPREAGGARTERPQLRFVGTRSVYKDVDLRGRALTILVRFRPGGAAGLLPAPAGELVDRSFEAEVLLGRQGTRMANRVAASEGGAEAKAHALQHLLAECLTPADNAGRPNLPVRKAVRRLQEVGGDVSVKALADATGRSARSLRSAFEREVGLSPKTFARVLRVKRAARLARQAEAKGGDFSWAPVALEAGFYDQSHMIKDFRALLGAPPSSYLKYLVG